MVSAASSRDSPADVGQPHERLDPAGRPDRQLQRQPQHRPKLGLGLQRDADELLDRELEPLMRV
jgi:hypothetical protein